MSKITQCEVTTEHLCDYQFWTVRCQRDFRWRGGCPECVDDNQENKMQLLKAITIQVLSGPPGA